MGVVVQSVFVSSASQHAFTLGDGLPLRTASVAPQTRVRLAGARFDAIDVAGAAAGAGVDGC